jgi:hypothetical protein
LGHDENSCVRRKAEHKDHVWTWDFIHDRTSDGRSMKWLSIVDEYTRECLALEVERGITSQRVIDVLAELFRIRGVPKHIRSDNGSEFIDVAPPQRQVFAGASQAAKPTEGEDKSPFSVRARIQNLLGFFSGHKVKLAWIGFDAAAAQVGKGIFRNQPFSRSRPKELLGPPAISPDRIVGQLPGQEHAKFIGVAGRNVANQFVRAEELQEVSPD